MLAVGAGGGCLDIFSLIYNLFSFSLSLGDGSISTEILSQRAVKPKTTNQPIFETVKSKVIILLFETVGLSVSISSRNLYDPLKSIKENKYIEDIYFFKVNTKYISSNVLKISAISLVLRTREIADIFNT